MKKGWKRKDVKRDEGQNLQERAKRNGEFKHAECRRLYVAGKRKILDAPIVDFFITGSCIR